MSISDIGCDILEIKRFKKAFKRRAKPLLDRLFTKTEQEYCLKFKDPTPHLAARFSAKEAVAKALGTGFGKKLSFLDIEIINDKNGKPTVLLSKKVQNQFSGSKLLVSISHSKEYVMAVAIKEYSQTKST